MKANKEEIDMDVALKAIETTGTIDIQHRLLLDEQLHVPGPTRVRVIILLPEDADISIIRIRQKYYVAKQNQG